MNNMRLKLVLSADQKNLLKGVNQSTQSIKSMDRSLGGAKTRAKDFGNTGDKAAQQASAGFNRAAKAASGFFAAFTVVQQVRQFTGLVAQYQNVETRLRSLSGSASAFAANEAFLIDLSADHHKSLLTLAGSYARIQALEKSQLVTREQSRALLVGMSNAGSSLGASNVQLEQSLFGVAQGFAAGKLRAEELNQVVDPLPGLLAELDKAADVSAGGFRKLVNAGKVTSALFKDTLLKALQQYDGAAARTADNLTAKYADIENQYTLLARALEQPLSDTLNPWLELSASALGVLANNTDVVIASAEALGLLMGAHLVNKVAATTTAYIAQNKVIVTKATADTAAAVAAQKLTAAELAASKAVLTRATATRAGMLGSQAATQGVLIAQRAVNAAEVAHAANLSRTLALTRTTTLATRALGGSLALLGGPLGIALLAAGALASFAMSADDALDPARKLAERVKGITKAMQSVPPATKNLQALNLKKEIEAGKQGIAELEELLTKGKKLAQDGFLAGGLQVPLSSDEHIEKAALLEQAILGLADAEKELQLLLNKPTKKVNTPTGSAVADPEGIAKIEEFLRAQDDKIKQAYSRRQGLLDNQLQAQQIKRTHYDELTKGLALKRDNELQTLRDQSAANALQATHEQQLRLASGFNTQAEQQATQHAQKLADIKQHIASAALHERRESEINTALGYNSQEEREVEEHQQRLIDIERRLKEEALGEFAEPVTYDDEAQRVQTSFDDKLMLIQERYGAESALEAQLTTQKNKKLAVLEQQKNKQTLGDAANTFGAMAGLAKAFGGEQSKSYRALFAISKTFSLAKAAMNMYTGISEGVKLGWPAMIPAIALAASQGAMAIAGVKGQSMGGIAHGGLTNVPEETTYLLQKNERVLSPRQNTDFTQFIQKEKNQQAVNSNLSINIQNNVSDEVSVNAQQNDNGTIELIIERVKAAVADDFNQGGGDVSLAAEGAYGLRRGAL